MHRLQGPAPTEDESIGALVARLGNDVTRIVRAEIGLFQARVAAVVGALRAAGTLILLGIVLALGGLGALVAGVVLVVAQWIGPWQAAFAVGGGLLVTAAVLLAAQARVVSAGIRDALSEVRVEVHGEERYRGY